MRHRSGFTLIELLVVIAIIAILSVVVVLALNPAQLLMQARDSNRVSDLATLNTSVGLFSTQSLTGNLGSAKTVYVSIPDPLATSTAGDQCQGLGLPALPASSTYQCAASSTYRKVDGTGWLPINLGSLPGGSPLSQLSADPTNSSSSGLYYTYTTTSSRVEFTSVLESSKYNSVMANDGGSYDGLYQAGTLLDITPPFRSSGLIGYWTFDEGAGSTAKDYSGSGTNGTWNGSGTHWATGKVGGAGQFASSTGDYVSLGSISTTLLDPQIFTISAWVQPTYPLQVYGFIFSNAHDCCGSGNGINLMESYSNTGFPEMDVWNSSLHTAETSVPSQAATWEYITGTYDGTTMKTYVNGVLSASTAYSGGPGTPASWAATIGGLSNAPVGLDFSGLIDDVRFYNRALSSAEINAIYNAEK